MKIKFVLRWSGIALLALAALYLSNTLLILPLRVWYSEVRIQKSIQLNYQNRKADFAKTIDYISALSLKQGVEIELKAKDQLHVFLYGPTSDMDSVLFDLSSDSLANNRRRTEFELLKNGNARINYLDSIIETAHWKWSFAGTTNDSEFEIFMDYTGIQSGQLDSLITFIKAVDCEAIFVDNNQSIVLRYDGFIMCQYEYLIPGNEISPPENYEQLGKRLYCGERRSELFCGSFVYHK